MTNEEKANELAILYTRDINDDGVEVYNVFAEAALLEMAQWKDERFKEALNNILIECDACFDEQTTTTLESIIKHQISIL